MSDDERLSRQKEGEDLHFAFAIVAALFSPMRQAGKFRSAPRNWLGKDLAYHCLDDLYTSPVHPHPPAWSAHLLYRSKEKHKHKLVY